VHYRFAFPLQRGIQWLSRAIQDNPVDHCIVTGTGRGQRLVRAGIIVDDENSRSASDARRRCRGYKTEFAMTGTTLT
jgi:hypothetical protein